MLLFIHANGIILYINCIFCFGQIRTLATVFEGVNYAVSVVLHETFDLTSTIERIYKHSHARP